MHVDQALKLIGEFGRYQKTRLFLLSTFAILSAWHALNMVFVGAEPGFECSTDDVNATQYNLNQSALREILIPEGASCYRYVPSAKLLGSDNEDANATEADREECVAGYVFSKDEYESTIISEFDLVCTRKHWRSTSKSIFFAGRLVGGMVISQLSDRFGRKPMFFVGLAMLLLAGGVAAAAPSMQVFLPFYFLQGAAHTGVYLVTYIMTTELVGVKYRVLASTIISIFYSLGYMSMAGIAYFIRNWRYLEIAITAPALLFIAYWWFLPESIRWLLSHNKPEEARRILSQAAESNGKRLDPELLKDLQEDPDQTGGRQYTLLDCLRTWRVARLSLNVWFNWLVNALVYYGLSLNTGSLAGSPYLNFMLAGAVEIPAYVLCILLLNRVGRRGPLIFTMYLGGVACIVCGVLPKDSPGLQTVTVVLAMVGKFAITASYNIVYLMAAEVFPTVIRNVGIGAASISARVGGILAPFILESASLLPVLPLLILGGSSLVAATLAFLLPETAGRPLPQYLDDVDSGRSCAKLFPCGGGKKEGDRHLEVNAAHFETKDHDHTSVM